MGKDERENEWATVVKKKGSEFSKVVIETKISLDLFIVGVLDQYYPGDPFEVTKSNVSWMRRVRWHM